MISLKLQKFLEVKMKESNFTKHELSQKINISYPMTNELLHANKPQPAISTLLKIAQAFDSSIDEILNRDDKKHSTLFNITAEEAMFNIESYISEFVKRKNINPKQLAKDIGLGTTAISDLIYSHKKKSLGTAIILKLADHIDVSIDEMIGRAPASGEKAVAKSKTESIAGISNPDDIDALKKIKMSLSKNISQPDKAASPIPGVPRSSQVKPKSHGR